MSFFTNGSSTSTLRIGIIGGGPAGLILARTLQLNGVEASIIIYERDPSSAARFQGGCLDLRPHSGQLALNHAGLSDRFRELARPEGQDFKALDKTGKIHVEEIGNHSGGEFFKPEIDRGDLRNMLLKSLRDGTIRWGFHLEKIIPIVEDMFPNSSRSRYQLHFSNGEKDIVDLVVGADGAWSKVRPLVSSSSPFYAGVTFIETSILPSTSSAHPALDDLVGQGSVFAFSESKGLMAQRNTGGVVRIYVALGVPESWLDDEKLATLADPAKSLQFLESLFDGWNDGLLDLLRYSEPDANKIIPRKLYMLPVGHTWAPRQGVTLVGDAGHVMTPFAGEGANIALLDGAELGLEIANRYQEAVARKKEDLGWLDQAIVACEKTMFIRSEGMARITEKSLRACLGPQGIDGMLEVMSSMAFE